MDFSYVALMKMKFLQPFSLAVASFLFLLLCGCKTTPSVDWNSRVGNYTYDQAITELGPPDKQAKLSDGKTVAEWVTVSGHHTSVGVGTGFFSGGAGVGIGQNIGSGYHDHVLKLTFGQDNKLIFWSKNY